MSTFNIYVNGDFAGGNDNKSVKLLTGTEVVHNEALPIGTIVLYDRSLFMAVEAKPKNRELRLTHDLGSYYLAGPMRGIKFRNYPMFLFATAFLRGKGFKIISPAENDFSRGIDPLKPGDTKINMPFDQAGLAYDFQEVCKADGIILLDGWENSEGAKAEAYVAMMTGKHILRLNSDMELTYLRGWTSSLTWAPPTPVKSPAVVEADLS